MNVGSGRQNIIILFGNNEAAQFHFWENINRNETIYIGFSRSLQMQGMVFGENPLFNTVFEPKLHKPRGHGFTSRLQYNRGFTDMVSKHISEKTWLYGKPLDISAFFLYALYTQEKSPDCEVTTPTVYSRLRSCNWPPCSKPHDFKRRLKHATQREVICFDICGLSSG